MLAKLNKETQERIFFWYNLFANHGLWHNSEWKLPPELTAVLRPYYETHYPDGMSFHFSTMDDMDKKLEPIHKYINVDNRLVVHGSEVGYVQLRGVFNDRSITHIVITELPTFRLLNILGIPDELRKERDKVERCIDKEILECLEIPGGQ